MAELPPGFRPEGEDLTTAYGAQPLPPGFTMEGAEFPKQTPEYNPGGVGYNLMRGFLYDEDLAKLINQQTGYPIRHDKEKDEWLVSTPDGEMAVNAKGFSQTDMAQMGVAGGSMLLGAGIGKWLLPKAAAPALNWLGKTKLGQGLVGGAYSAAADVTGDVATDSPIDVDWTRVGLEAGGSFLGQGAGNAITGIASRAARRGQHVARSIMPGQKLKGSVEEKLKAAGIDPASLTPDQIVLANQAEPIFSGYQPADAGRAIFMESQGVRPTVGSMTQNPAHQMQEDLISKGQYGPSKQAMIQAPQAENATRVKEIGESMAPSGASVASAQSKLVDIKNRLTDTFNNSFQNLREMGKDTFLHPDAGRAIRDDLYEFAKSKSSDYELADSQIFKGLDDLLDQGGDLNFNDLFAWRRQVGKQGAVGQQVATMFDEGLERANAMMLMRGDPDAVNFSKLLNEQYKGFKNTWEAKDLFDQLIRMDGQKAKLKVSPQEATNFLFGANDTGWTTKRGLHGALMKMRKQLHGTREWNELKQVLGRKIMGLSAIKESVDDQTTRLNGAHMRKAYETAMDSRGDLMRTIFSPEEISMMDNFTRMASWLTRKPGRGGAINSTTPLGVNPSFATRSMEGLLPKGMIKWIPFINALEGGLETMAERKAGNRAVEAALNPAWRGPKPKVPGAGVTLEKGAEPEEFAEWWKRAFEFLFGNEEEDQQ